MPKYIDIHAHVNFKAFDEDRDEVIARALEADTWVINVGTQVDTSKKAVELAHKYREGVYAVIGLHPIHTEKSYHDKEEWGDEGAEFTSRGEEFDKNNYRALLLDPKTVAIGECGLDYYHIGSTSSPQGNTESIEKQKKAFIGQIELAEEIGKPVMLHLRNHSEDKNHNVYFDACEILKNYPSVKGVSHFFAGNVEDMKRFVAMGIYVSFAGPITYKPKPEICDYVGVIKETPLEFILTDTDSPYVAPVPHRGKRNEPSYVSSIVKKIAEIKNLSEDEVAKAIVANAKRLFKI